MQKYQYMANLTKIIIPTFILLVIFVGVISVYSGKSQKPIGTEAAQYLPVALAAPLKSNIMSPDGKASLTVKERKDGVSTLWTVMVDNNVVFSESLPDNVSVYVPFNTFSPDDKYIFLKEVSNGNDTYIVLTTSGKPILVSGEDLEISKYFYGRYADYKITDVTGWAAPTLIVVNADKVDGGESPSFWFDVSSKSFTQLSTRFN